MLIPSFMIYQQGLEIVTIYFGNGLSKHFVLLVP